MSVLSRMTNNKLADLIERRYLQLQTAQTAVFNTIKENNVPFQKVLADLPKDHTVRVAYEAASRDVEDARNEAVRRCGPISATSLYVTMLRRSPRFRRKAAA